MLLPDQTYEQCQVILAPLKAIRKILEESNVEPKLLETSQSTTNSSNAAKSVKTKSEKVRKIDRSSKKIDDVLGADRVRGETPESFRKTSEFFNNIPDYAGDPMGPFSLPHQTTTDDNEVKSQTSADVLKECELFLHKHRIRPDFFCRYRKALE